MSLEEEELPCGALLRDSGLGLRYGPLLTAHLSDLTLSQISEKDFRKEVMPLLSDALSTTPEEYTPEHLAVLLQLESLFKVPPPSTAATVLRSC